MRRTAEWKAKARVEPHLLRVFSPTVHGFSELHLVWDGHVHLVEQGVELVVGGFEDEHARDVLDNNGSRVFGERGFYAFDLRRRVSGSAVGRGV